MSDLEFQHYPIDINDIPKSWSITNIATLGATVQSGFPTGEHNKEGRGIPHIRPMNIDRNGTIDLNDVKYVSPATSDLRLQQGDVLFNNTNSTELIGKTAAITHCDDWGFSNHMTRLRFPDTDVEYRFAAHQLHYLWIARYFRHRCVNHVNQASISGKPLAQTVPFLVAPICEQRRIVAKIEELFSELDAGVAALERAKANLKRYRAAVLKAAVEGKLTEAWRSEHPATEPASELLERILKERRQKWEADQLAKFAAAKKEPPKNWKEKYVEPAPPDTKGLPELPKGWCWATIQQLAFVDVGFAFKSAEFAEEGVRLLRGENMEPGKLRWKDVRYWPNEKLAGLEQLLVREGQIILAMDRPLVSAGLKIAKAHANDLPCLLVQRMARLRMIDDQQNDFLYCSMQTQRFIVHLLGDQTGTQLPHISGSGIEEFVTPLPPMLEQQHISSEIAKEISQIEAAEIGINHSLYRAARLRQSILKQAFEGKLVPQDPTDEPVSVTIEQLKEALRPTCPNGDNKKKSTKFRTSRNVADAR